MAQKPDLLTLAKSTASNALEDPATVYSPGNQGEELTGRAARMGDEKLLPLNLKAAKSCRGYAIVDCVRLARNRIQWSAVVGTVMNLGVP